MVCGLVFLVISATAIANPHARPFKGQVVGTITFRADQTLPPPGMWVTSAAVGNASHFGLTTMSAKHIAANAFGGEMTLTAANGDTVTMSYAGAGTIPADIQIGDWCDTTWENTIISGTGRFAHATGKYRHDREPPVHGAGLAGLACRLDLEGQDQVLSGRKFGTRSAEARHREGSGPLLDPEGETWPSISPSLQRP